jgi:hypothetical protein
LLEDGRRPTVEQRWAVCTPPASSVVIDFVAGEGMLQAKNYCGYFLRSGHGGSIPGEGMLVLYDFGREPVSGELVLDGDAWTFGTGTQRATLLLQPGQRREIPVLVRFRRQSFEANPVRATWRVVREPRNETAAIPPPPPTPEVSVSKAESRGIAVAAPFEASFEPYIRTRNGNLYQTSQRLMAREAWQLYMERMGNITMAFFGRANLPWRYTDNEPASLVFFFRPEQLPATFEIRRAQVVEFVAPSSP